MSTEYERERSADETEEPIDRDDAEEQDFGLRNVAMSNALPSTAQPSAGAVIGSEGELGMQPETDEERADESGGSDAEEAEDL